jgi:hypothetical protein
MSCKDFHLGLVVVGMYSQRQFNLVNFPYDEVLIHRLEKCSFDGMDELSLCYRRI